MSDGNGVTWQGWVPIFTFPWGLTVMAENVSLPAMFPSHLVTLSAAQAGGVVSRGWIVLCLFLQVGKLSYGMVVAEGVGSPSGAAAALKTAPASAVLLRGRGPGPGWKVECSTTQRGAILPKRVEKSGRASDYSTSRHPMFT